MMMRYLGELNGAGHLKVGDQTIGRVDYEIEGYMVRVGEVTGSGEIRMPAESLKEVFGRTDILLETHDGRLLGIRFSEKRLQPSSDTAHVDVTGDLPPPSEWRH
jgi:hypothetical protein